jgi:hypothetical protein
MNESSGTLSELYHVTPVENLEEILESGIQPQESHRNKLEADLGAIAATNGIKFPIERQRCVFLYPTLSAATEQLRFAQGESPLFEREAMLVVDGRQLERDLYVGDFDLISDAIDLQHMDEPDEAISAASYEDALRRYASGLEVAPSFEALPQVTSRYTTPEVVVEGSVGPEKIVEWRLLKTIRTGN